MPIIFSLLDTPAFGGAEQYLLAQLTFLHQQGYRIVVATNHPQVKQLYQQAATQAKLAHFEVINAPYRLDIIGNWKGLVKFFGGAPAALWWCYHTLKQLRLQGPVLCYWPGWTDRLLFSRLAHQMGLPLLWVDIGPLEPLFSRNWGLPQKLYNSVKQLPNTIITTSKFTWQSLERTAKISSPKIRLIYPGIKTLSSAEIQRFRRQGQQWRQQHQLLKKTLIGYVGRLASENEVELVIEALGQLKHRGVADQYQLHLVLMGDGPERARLQQLVSSLDLAQHVTYTGFINENLKYSLLAACEMFTFTRAWELDGFGMTTIEAMSVGTAVITNDFGPQKEIVQHNRTGRVFKPHDYHSLAKQIEWLAAHPTDRRRLAKAGLRHVQATFNLEKSHRQLLEIISSYQPV